MAYNKEDLYKECISVACDYDIKFIEHLVEKIPCRKTTFYSLFPLNSTEYKSIVSIINANRMKIGYSNYPYSKNKKSNADMKTYLIKDNNTGFYKIGKSKNPLDREKTLQSEKPIIKMVKTWDEDIEKKLHKDYSEFRIRGEWFNLTKIQVRYICTHY